MRAYFLVAKDVGDLTRIFCAALEEQNKKKRPSLSSLLPGFLKPRTGDEDFYVENGRLNARPNAFRRDPVNLIRIFHMAEAKRVDVHPDALRTITRSLDLITDEVRNDANANRLFLEILTSPRDPERALRWLNEAGVLGRFVPAFAHAVALMQFNMYHHYTVDEHLIRAVGNVAAIERGELKAEHPAGERHHQAHQVARNALLRDPSARYRQRPARQSFARRRGDRREPVPAPRAFARRYGGRGVAGEKPSRHERHGAAARHRRSQDRARFRRASCNRRRCCGSCSC